MGSHPGRETLSVCLITLDEQERLPRALQSVSRLADELVVVDSGSSDATRDIARAAGAVVIEHPWQGYAAQRNAALDHATADWVLELDADEWCTAELARELAEFLEHAPPHFKAGLIPMRQRFLGRELSVTGHYPFYRTRLFRRDAYRHDERRAVHEGLWPREQPWVFEHDLVHELANTVGEAIRDTLAYARLEAEMIPGASARALATGIFVRPAIKFVYRTLLLAGWRDGLPGMLRTALECAGDVFTWIRVWRRPSQVRTPAAAISGHFGHTAPRVGPPRLLALGDPTPWRPWLEEAVSCGAIVSVICPGANADPGFDGGGALRIRPLQQFGIGALLRAIDAEIELAPVDAWIALDRFSRVALRLLPFAEIVFEPPQFSAAEVVRAALSAR